MPNLTTQKVVRPLQQLPFCYLCGKPFDANSEKTKDHVPPEAIFATNDRNFPLALPTHGACNRDRSSEDEVIGQLVSLLHGRIPKEGRNRLDVEIRKADGYRSDLGVFTGLDLNGVIRGWVKGFHAALYRQALPDHTLFATQTPFPSGELKEGEIHPHEIPRQHEVFVEELKRNRMTGSLDTIICNNGRLKYECVWVRMDDKGWGCVFALDLYGWKQLGDIHNFEARGCAGLYRTCDATAPVGCAISTVLNFPVENNDRLDPFSR